MSEVVELKDDTFAEHVAKGVSVVDFYGTYCPPCKLLEPVMEQLAENFSGKVAVGKINIDDNSEAAVDNSIDDIPTVLVFKDGVEVKRLFGAQKLTTFTEEIEKVL